jgi:hypothetical protein
VEKGSRWQGNPFIETGARVTHRLSIVYKTMGKNNRKNSKEEQYNSFMILERYIIPFKKLNLS